MTPPPPLIDQNGRLIRLDRQLGSPGGEGTVFALSNEPTLVAKVYHPQERKPERFEKLMAMIALSNSNLLTVAAWPRGLLFDDHSGQPVGFTMPLARDCQPIQHLYNPVQRLKCFPRAGWAFQVRAAVNLAAAFDEIHRAGCLMGDVNERNELVSPQALVRLIDCDSFQLRANGKPYLCEVGVVHFTPPELQGKSFRGLVRTENHDRFGLAVLIYKLLFVGRHPYMGLHGDEAPFEQLIAEYRFAQGPAARNWGMAPPPHTPTFADIPPEVGALFRRAFERGSESGTRPRPAEWLSALKRLEREIVECPADPGHKYWRGAKSCVWCRLADHGGPEYYFGVAGGVGTFAVDEARLQGVLRRLAAVEPIEIRYNRERFAPANPPRAKPLPEEVREQRTIEIVLAVTAGLCVAAVPFGLVHGAISVIGLLGALIFGVWLAIVVSQSPRYREWRRRQTAHKRALDDLGELEDEWEQTVKRSRWRNTELSEEVRRSVSDCRGLAAQYQGELKKLSDNAEAVARLRHLRLHLIADADIPKIGAGRMQTLAAHHIYTAADIDESVIRRIKGFGDALTGNLLAWRKEVLRRFRFDPTTAISSAEQRSVTVRFRARQKQFLTEAEQQLAMLESLAPNCRAAIQKLLPRLQVAVAEYEQTRADLSLLTRWS